jgi:SAM-dependent methyltransferase
VSFEVAAEAYGRFMGRYSAPLALEFIKLVGARRGHRVLDVGCGPGILTVPLVERLGADAVAAIDPSEAFVAALRARLPDVDVRHGASESLPFADGEFDIALAQLVVHFMTDPVAGIRDMARVTYPGGLVAASVWDYEYGRSPVSFFWRAAHDIDPGAPGEAHLAGTREGHLVEIFEQAGLHDVRPATLEITVELPDFDDWWEPYTLGVGPAGQYMSTLSADHREAIREHCKELLPDGAISIEAAAWVALGRVTSG